jgi:YD repeat-containing protein
MKKIFVSNLLIVALFFYSCSQVKNNQIKNDLTKDKIKGQVLSITETEYEAIDRFGKIEKGRLISKSITKYDNYGNELENNIYNEKSELTNKTIYKYNESDKKIEEHDIDYKTVKESNQSSFKFFKYDNKGNLIQDSTVFSFPSELGSKFIRTTYTFDNNGNEIEQIGYSGMDLYDKRINKYDDNNNLIENAYYVGDSLQLKVFSKYDSNGNEIENNVYNSDGIRLLHKTNFKYDDKGNIREQNGYNEAGQLSEKVNFKYEFDKKNNWVKRIASDGKTAMTIVEREIEYK